MALAGELQLGDTNEWLDPEVRVLMQIEAHIENDDAALIADQQQAVQDDDHGYETPSPLQPPTPDDTTTIATEPRRQRRKTASGGQRRRGTDGEYLQVGEMYSNLVGIHRGLDAGNAVILPSHRVAVCGFQQTLYRIVLVAGPHLGHLLALWLGNIGVAVSDSDALALSSLESVTDRRTSPHMAVLKRGVGKTWHVVAVWDSAGIHEWDPLKLAVSMHSKFLRHIAETVTDISAKFGIPIDQVATVAHRAHADIRR